MDIAFGGHFYAIADSEAIGVPIDMANAAALIRMGREITDAVESTVHVQHPIDAGVKDVQGTIVTGAARGAADLRSATRRSQIGEEIASIVPVIEGAASITGFHEFVGG